MLTGVIGTAGEGREDALETEVQEYGKIELDKWLKRNKDGLVKQIFNSKDEDKYRNLYCFVQDQYPKPY